MTGICVVPFSVTGIFRWFFPERRSFVVWFVFFLVLAPEAAAGITELNNITDSIGNASWQSAAGQTFFMTLPAIAPNTTPGFFVREYTFPFREENITIPINVSAAVYYGAKNGDKFATTRSGGPPEALAPVYYRAFVNDPAQEALYADLLDSFRIVRREHRYSDDEYAEMLTVFVQNLPYDNLSAVHPDTLSRFPAETLVDGVGDCDDKSVLLAGLLSREGYNASLLLFIPEHHMAVGLAGDCLPYNDTGYMYIETTGLSFIGDVPDRLNQSEKYMADGQGPGTTPLTSVPLVIRVGAGSRNFTRGGETGSIIAWKKGIDVRIASLKDQITACPPEDLPRFRMLVGTYNAYAAVHNYIAKHRYDRSGTYRYLVSAMQHPCIVGQKSFVAQLVSQPRTPTPPESPVCGPASGCPSPSSFHRDFPVTGYLPCPREIPVSQQCRWQDLRQALVLSTCQTRC